MEKILTGSKFDFCERLGENLGAEGLGEGKFLRSFVTFVSLRQAPMCSANISLLTKNAQK